MPAYRAAIYARFSSDHQRDASIEDQFRVCRQLAESKGWTVVRTFADRAISGATQHRPQFQELQAEAKAGQFDIVISESLDRLSRDLEHIAGFAKTMTYLGIPIFTVAEGEISELHIGLKGTMSALYLKDLAQKTHRGLEGRIQKGKSAGGISYGYRVIRELLPDGSVTTGDRSIHKEEAAVIRRIFTDYAKGASAQAIAKALNSEGITGPMTGKGCGEWNPSTIAGNAKRGTGILNNEAYIGKLVWNRQRYVKNPETGKRQARLNPPDQWQYTDVPELRIINDDLWDAVKARQKAIRVKINPAGCLTAGLRPERARRPVYLFSGLVKCGCCGSSYTLINKTRYGCAAARNKGEAICTNRATILREDLEDRVITGLRDRLWSPKMVSAFADQYRKSYNNFAANVSAEREKAERQLAKTQSAIDQITKAVEDGMYHPSMIAKLTEHEATKEALELELASEPPAPTLRLHPSMSTRFKEHIHALSVALREDHLRTEAVEILRGFVSEVRMVPDASARGGHQMELVGDLAGILQLSHGDESKRHSIIAGGSVTLVAGVGFEPTTFRL